MPHSPERRAYLTNWANEHRAMLRALSDKALKKLRPTVYTIVEVHSRKIEQEIKKGLRLPRRGLPRGVPRKSPGA